MPQETTREKRLRDLKRNRLVPQITDEASLWRAIDRLRASVFDENKLRAFELYYGRRSLDPPTYSGVANALELPENRPREYCRQVSVALRRKKELWEEEATAAQ